MTGSFKTLSCATAAAVSLTLSIAASAAEPQDNRCWGEVASQLAQAESADGLTGGGMGLHSRSGTAASINGGFGQSQPRSGVGNVSLDAHGVHPSDGGNGQHAANNGEALTLGRNAVTGIEAGEEGFELETFECSTLEGENPFVP